MNDIVKQEQTSGILSVIERVALDPNVDVSKLERLLEMQERIMGKQAEIEFNLAMTRLQPKLKPIKHTAKIKHNDKLISTYTKYEDIDKEIRPLYSEEGFSISFNSKVKEGGKTTYYATLSHKDGHSKTAEMELPSDTSGAKNAIQAIGSTVSYAKRYLVSMLLNITTEGEDDDAQSVNTVVTIEQAAEIDVKIKDVGADKDKFLTFMGVKDVRDIRAGDYQKAMNALKAKGKK